MPAEGPRISGALVFVLFGTVLVLGCHLLGVTALPLLGPEHEHRDDDPTVAGRLIQSILPHEPVALRIIGLIVWTAAAALMGAAAKGLTGSPMAIVVVTFAALAHAATLASAPDPGMATHALPLALGAGACFFLIRRQGVSGVGLALLLGTGGVLIAPRPAIPLVVGTVPILWQPKDRGYRRVLLIIAGGIAVALFAGPFFGNRSPLAAGLAILEVLLPSSAAQLPPWSQLGAMAVPLCILIILGHFGRQPGDPWRLLPGFLVLLAAGATTGPQAADPDLLQAQEILPGTLGLAWVIGLWSVRSAAVLSGRGRILAGGALLLWVLANHNAARAALNAHVEARRETARVARSVRDLPPLGGTGLDVVIGLPAEIARLPGPRGHLGVMFPDRMISEDAALPDPGGGRWLRVLSWEPVAPLLASDPGSWILRTGFAAIREEQPFLQLREPVPGAYLPCRTAEDEPIFAFSTASGTDLSADTFLFASLGIAAGDSGPRLLIRRLDATILQRTDGDGIAIWQWKPSWRSQIGEERELRWEAEEIGRRGTSFTWTILSDLRRRSRPVLMAVPRTVIVLP